LEDQGLDGKTLKLGGAVKWIDRAL